MSKEQREYERSRLDLENVCLLSEAIISYEMMVKVVDRFCRASDDYRETLIDQRRLSGSNTN